MGPSMCSEKNKSLVRRRGSALSLPLVAMIIRCSSVKRSTCGKSNATDGEKFCIFLGQELSENITFQ